jgi:hypothetical protein
MSETSGTKRKRSAIACTVCHDRKVRCNVAISGVPCSNCALDNTVCRIYGRRPSVFVCRGRDVASTLKLYRGPERAIRPRIATPADETIYPSTPSTAVSTAANSLRSDNLPHSSRASVGQPTRLSQTDLHATADLKDVAQKPPGATQNDGPLVPFYAGDAEGLEFLIDICYPVSIDHCDPGQYQYCRLAR